MTKIGPNQVWIVILTKSSLGVTSCCDCVCESESGWVAEMEWSCVRVWGLRQSTLLSSLFWTASFFCRPNSDAPEHWRPGRPTGERQTWTSLWQVETGFGFLAKKWQQTERKRRCDQCVLTRASRQVDERWKSCDRFYTHRAVGSVHKFHMCKLRVAADRQKVEW